MDTQDLVEKIKQYPVAVGFGIIALAAAIGYYFRMGAVEEYTTLRDEVKAKATTMAANVKAAGTVGRPGAIEMQVEDLKELESEIETRLMDLTRLSGNVQYFLTKAEADSDLVIPTSPRQIAVPTDAREGKAPLTKFSPIEFDIRGQGTFKNLLKYLRLIENGRYFARVQSFGIDAQNVEVPDTVNFSLNVEVLGVLRPDEVKAPVLSGTDRQLLKQEQAKIAAGDKVPRITPRERRTEVLAAITDTAEIPEEDPFFQRLADVDNPFTEAPEEPPVLVNKEPETEDTAPVQPEPVEPPKPQRLEPSVVLRLADRQLKPTGHIARGGVDILQTTAGMRQEGVSFDMQVKDFSYTIMIREVTNEGYVLEHEGERLSRKFLKSLNGGDAISRQINSNTD